MKTRRENDWEVFIPVGAHTQTAAISSATTLTIPAGATKVMMQAQTQNVRFTIDGTAPTATVGFLIVKDAVPLVIHLNALSNTLKVIEVTTTAVFDYQFGRE